MSIRIIASSSWGPAAFPQNTPPPPTPPQATHPAVHSHRPNVRNGPPASELCAACVQDNLNYLAGPELHGRGSGTNDQHKAAEFIADKLKQYGLSPAADGGQYIQTIRQEVSSQGETASATGETRKLRQTWNVLAKIEGATRKKQVIMLSAHLDHLGTKDGKTYFGADDDASGCAAVMELARMLTEGGTTQRTVVVA